MLQTTVRSRRGFAPLLMLTAMLISMVIGDSRWSNVAASTHNSVAVTGSIAYVVADKEIRIIEADGSNDRSVWSVPDAQINLINGISWKPDGEEIAFTSDHEQTCSLRKADVYTVKVDGTNVRRITNAPACADLASYPKGSVTVKVANLLFDVSLVFVYVQGAPTAQSAVIPVGTSTTITFNDVADLGDGIQQAVVVHSGLSSWIDPLASVDVVANAAVTAGQITLGNANKLQDWRASSPSWRRDGNVIGFTVGEIGMYTVPIQPGIGDMGARIDVGDGVFASAVAFSPVDDDVLFYDGNDVYRATPGQSENPAPLVEVTNIFSGMDWLPDGSGFVYSSFSNFLGFGNLYLYRFADATLTQLTHFTDAYAYHPSVSPDGQHLVYAYLAAGEETPQLMIRSLDGAQTWPLGVSGAQPDWGTGAQDPQPIPTPTATLVPTPSPTDGSQKVYLPAVVR